jgi:hypothetical protein
VFSALVLSLSSDLRTTFKTTELKDEMEAPSLLLKRIRDHFEAGQGINPVYLKRALLNRVMQPGETVAQYAHDVEQLVRRGTR